MLERGSPRGRLPPGRQGGVRFSMSQMLPFRACSFLAVARIFCVSHPPVVLLYVLRACFFCLRAGSLNRAQAVLVLCRGLFTPGHNKEPSRVHDNVHGCALRHEHGGYPLEEAFAEVCWIGVDNYIEAQSTRLIFFYFSPWERSKALCRYFSRVEVKTCWDEGSNIFFVGEGVAQPTERTIARVYG